MDGPTEPAGDPTLGPERYGPNERPLQRGDAVGRYVVLERLGVGGMGVVYAAYDPELDRKIALKLLLPAASGQRPALRAQSRLQREARALARLSHPHVVALHDVGTHDDQLWIAMEFVAGETLDAYVRRTRPSLRAALGLLDQAGQGVAALHTEGLIHRDLKPSNIMVTDEPGRGPRVRVMDLGLARVDEADVSDASASDERRPLVDAELTEAGATPGTPAYMAPEQHAGRKLDAAADQFGFCVLAWEVLAGERPFGGETRGEVAAAILEGRPRPLPASVTLPRTVRSALVRGLSRDRRDRFDDMGALLAALARGSKSRRRAWMGATFLGLNAAALVSLSLSGFVTERDRCDTMVDDAAVAWSSKARMELGDRLESFGGPRGRATAKHVATRLDRWIEDWADAAELACGAADQLPGDPSDDESHDRAWTCLRDQRMGALEQVELAASVERPFMAIDALTRLPEPARCLDEGWLALGTRARREPSTAALASRARRLDAIAGRQEYGGLVTKAQDLVADADEAGSDAIGARARLHLGTGLQALARYAEATAVLQAGFRQAGRVGDDGTALALAITLVRSNYDAGHADRAEVWLDTAQQLSIRRGVSEELPGAGVHLAASYLRWAQGRSDEALGHVLAARRTLDEQVGPHHPQVVRALARHGLIATDQGDFEGAREAFVEGLVTATELFGPRHPQVAMMLHNLARLEFKAGRRVRAIGHLQRAYEIKAAVFGGDSPRAARALAALGKVEETVHALDRSRRHTEDVLEILHRDRTVDPEWLTEVTLRVVRATLYVGDVDGARSAFERLASKLPAFEPALVQVRVEKALLAGLLAKEEGRTEASRAHIERAKTILDHDPAASSVPVYVRAPILEGLGSLLVHRDPERSALLLDEATEQCKQVWDDGGPCWQVYLARARLALARGDAERALHFADAARSRIAEVPHPQTDRAEVIVVWARALAATGAPDNLARASEVHATLRPRMHRVLPAVHREYDELGAVLGEQ